MEEVKKTSPSQQLREAQILKWFKHKGITEGRP